MKKKIIFIIALVFTFALASCDKETGQPAKTETASPTQTSTQTSPTKTDVNTTTATEVKLDLAGYKALALGKLDEMILPVISKTVDPNLNQAILTFYANEKAYISDIKDLDTAKAAATKIIADAEAFTSQTLIPLVTTSLNNTFNPVIAKLPNGEFKTDLQAFYSTELEKLSAVSAIDELNDTYLEIVKDLQEFFQNESAKQLNLLKAKEIEELDAYVVNLINKISYEELKSDTQEFYATEKAKVQELTSSETLNSLVETIKADLLELSRSHIHVLT